MSKSTAAVVAPVVVVVTPIECQQVRSRQRQPMGQPAQPKQRPVVRVWPYPEQQQDREKRRAENAHGFPAYQGRIDAPACVRMALRSDPQRR